MVKEALKYLQNAKEILSKVPIENDTYTEIKPVREAFGTAYLAVLEAINEALIEKGLTKKELPKLALSGANVSVEAYREVLRRHLAVRNGKLMREFEKLYDMLHIAGYYRGLLYDVDTVKDAFKAAKAFIEKIK